MAIKKAVRCQRSAVSQKNFGKIGVLMGGPSSEREISLKSGKAVYNNLKKFGLDVIAIDIKTDNEEENIQLIKNYRIDCAFLALHGRFGEDGQIQEILEKLKIVYTGSGVIASRLSMDKIASRRIFKAEGLNVPPYIEINKSSYTRQKDYNTFGFPLVVKPATHGSSIGLSIVDNKDDFDQAIRTAFEFDERIIIEEYIVGRELTVGILGDQALPVIEIVPRKRFFDYEAKYSAGMTDYIVPAQLKEEVALKVQRAGLSAHGLLGCYGCSRIDLILSNDDIPFILEVNSIPGLTETSLLPKAAGVLGINFIQLCIKLIELAYDKA